VPSRLERMMLTLIAHGIFMLDPKERHDAAGAIIVVAWASEGFRWASPGSNLLRE
jgi:hypothetical protein